jgi:hypothetical protein
MRSPQRKMPSIRSTGEDKPVQLGLERLKRLKMRRSRRTDNAEGKGSG